jgi:methionine-rich copper-binding protein CopC
MTLMRALGRSLVLLVLAATALAPSGAFAHSNSVDSDPADDAHVKTLPRVATVTFNEPVAQAAFALTEPGGHVVKVKASIDGPIVTASLPGTGPKGDYVLAYRVVSADGHPVTGEVEFTVTTGRAPQTQDNGQAQGHAQGPSGTSTTATGALGVPLWGVIGGAAILAALAALLVRAARR